MVIDKSRTTLRRFRSVLTRTVAVLSETVDLLDLAVIASFGLIAAGCWLLWGAGWACLALGLLLLGLVLIGAPVNVRKPQ